MLARSLTAGLDGCSDFDPSTVCMSQTRCCSTKGATGKIEYEYRFPEDYLRLA